MNEFVDINKYLSAFRNMLNENSDPKRAAKEKSYLKSPFKFFGVTLPFIEKMARDFKRANKDIDKGFVFELAKRLWYSTHES
ncbi:MAG: DNA alkylation repair protein [Nitrospirota bacterium]